LKKIMEIWPTDVRIVLHNRPLEFHKRATPAAIAFEAAGRQNKAWEYHDVMFETKKFEDADLTAHATALGMDVAKFEADLKDPVLAARVKQQDAACVKVTASGTPAFFVNGRKLSGAKPFEDFEPVIKEELVKAKAEVAKGISRDAIYEHMLKLGKKKGPAPLDPLVHRFNNVGQPAYGPASAPATITIFSDFECPFCSRIVAPVHDAQKQLGNQLRVVFRQYPLTTIHPNARPAAIASLAAHKQGKFWAYHDLLFQNQKRLGPTDLVNWAKALGLDVAKFEADLKDPALQRQMTLDNADAIKAGVRGTPSLFLNGRRIKIQATSADALVDLIETEILGK
jgi:protein-disulfide isomerase